MEGNLIFGLPAICGVIPLLVYIILAFKKGMNTIVNVVVCVLIGAVLLMQGPKQIATQLYSSIGSFLGLVGMMIMCGSGLGAILRKTGVAGNIVNFLINKVGVNSTKRAILSVMICSDVMVVLLGTLAGANAVIAPIVIPLVAIVGLTPWTVSVIFQGAGQAALFLSPVSAATMVLMEATGAPYPQVLLWAGLPLFLVMNIGTYFVACNVQKKSAGKVAYSADDIGGESTKFEMTPAVKRSTIAFVVTMLVMVAIGIAISGGAAFAVVIMMVTAVITGRVGKLSYDELIDTFCEGCGKLVNLFIMFVLFDMFLVYVTNTGAFDALVGILEPLAMGAGKVGFTLIIVLIGIFGIQGAAVAQVAVITALFADMVAGIGLSTPVWAMAIVIGSQVTSFAYPGSDMMGAMGIARCTSIKPMMQLAYTAIIPGTVLLSLIWALVFG